MKFKVAFMINTFLIWGQINYNQLLYYFSEDMEIEFFKKECWKEMKERDKENSVV